jgi:hypothetical protein
MGWRPPDSDADGFAVSWGRYCWHNGMPSLSFERHLAVDGSADWTEAEWVSARVLAGQSGYGVR